MSSEVGEIVDAAVESVVEQSSDEIGVEKEQPDVVILHKDGDTLAQ